MFKYNNKGTNIANWSTNVTNCLLEVPQNIKLELNNGVLKLKAGSQVIVPNGFEADGTTLKFDYADITSDMIPNISSGSTSLKYVCVIQNNVYPRYFGTNQCFSGATAPTGGNYLLWYDTTNNLIKESQDGGVTWLNRKFSFPVCLFSANGNQFTSIDQVFNGFGYIGSHYFIDKGVKGLIPNGRNEDGTLNNIEYTQQYVKTEYLTNNSNFYIGLGLGTAQSYNYVEQEEEPTTNYTVWYKPSENRMYRKSGSGVVTENKTFVGFDITTGQSGITSLKPKLPFRAVDYSDKSTISGWGMPSSKYIDLALGVSGSEYIAPANGWYYLAMTATSSTAYIILRNSVCYITNQSNTTSDENSSIFPCLKGERIYVEYSNGNKKYFRFIYAEGEV